MVQDLEDRNDLDDLDDVKLRIRLAVWYILFRKNFDMNVGLLFAGMSLCRSWEFGRTLDTEVV